MQVSPPSKILCLAYPCKVGTGIPVKSTIDFVLRTYDIGRESDFRDVHENRLRRFFPTDIICEGTRLLNMEREDIKQKAKILGGKWDLVAAEDNTMMKSDFNTFKACETICRLNSYHNLCQVFVAEPDMQVGNIRSYLRGAEQGEVKFLCLMGHGLSEETAKQLHPQDDDPPLYQALPTDDHDIKRFKSPRWPWPLTFCNGREGLGYTAHKVMTDAKNGDVVVFTSGLLSIEWVLKQLQDRERNAVIGNYDVTLVLLVDSCHSGAWADHIQQKLCDLHLKHTRLIVQTACSADEVSYGEYFIPLWCALQTATKEDLENTRKIVPYEVMQNPRFVDSQQPPNPTGYKSVLLNGCTFRFFDEPKFFHQFVSYRYQTFTANPRGIPDSHLPQFFESLADKESTTSAIGCFKLRTYTNNSRPEPLAFILVEWNHFRYHLHLHFDSFNVDSQKVDCITHVDVKSVNHPCPRYKFKEVKGSDSKSHLRPGNRGWPDDRVLKQIVDRCKLHVDRCKEFDGNWENPASWKMEEGIPKLIRSRSAIIKLIRSKSAIIKELQDTPSGH